MSNIPLQGLERANYTADSDAIESTRRVNVGNDTTEPIPVIKDASQLQVEQTQMISALRDVSTQLKKINFYFELMTEVTPTPSDISDTLT